MKSERITFSLLFAALVICPTLSPAQTFGTTVTGDVVMGTCPEQSYNRSGTGDISDQTSASCNEPPPSESASASSQASLDTQEIAMVSAGGTLASTDSSATATQTATLLPPGGFNGNSVKVKYKDIYAFKLSGVEGGLAAGEVQACWSISQAGLQQCQEQTTNGTHSGVVHQSFVLPKSQSGFQLTITKRALATVAVFQGTASGSAITAATPKLKLPKGWSCTYDSGTQCP